MKRKAARLRKATCDEKYWAPLDHREGSILHAIMFSIYTPFSKFDHICPILPALSDASELMLFDRMALSLNVW